MTEEKENVIKESEDVIILMNPLSELEFARGIVILEKIDIKPKSGLDLTGVSVENLTTDAFTEHPFQGYVKAHGAFEDNEVIKVKINERVLFDPSYRFYEFVFGGSKYLMVSIKSIIAKYK